MGAVRVLRFLGTLALVAGLATACGNGSSSDPGSDAGTSTGVANSTTVQLRPVSARYIQDPAKGQEQLGPTVPKDLVDTMKGYDCSSQPTELQGMLLECDSTRTVFLLQSPLLSGGVASAVPLRIGHGKEWYVKLTFDQAAAATLAKAADTMTGEELAVVLKGKVLTALIVDSSMKDGHIGITGDLNQKQATTIAHELSA
jgi:preprotein translocase subunit SecD